jgi:hypothetical protein
MATHNLSELQYSEDRQGPWKLYVYEPYSEYHRGGVWFRRGKAKYPDEELGFTAAKVKCANAMRNNREVRICDGGDNLVFHAQGSRILFGEKFWDEIGPAAKSCL